MTTIQQLNRELADKLMEEAQRNPKMAFIGKFIGIANGKLVIVTDDLNELAHQLEQTEPDSSKTLVLEPGHDLSKVHEIWEVC